MSTTAEMAKPRRRIVLSPFGRHTRYLLAGYFRHVFTVISILLAIGLTIDLWPQFQDIAARSSGGLGSTLSIFRFALLRTPGIIAPLIPFATFIGVLWTEVAHTQSGERMLVWNSGRSPIQCLAPALLLGIVLGAITFTMDAYWGPASMGIQMKERLGRDGAALDRAKLSKQAWIALPEGLLRATIAYGPPPVLHDVAIFRRDRDGHLQEVDTAPIAQSQEGSSQWLLSNGQYWSEGHKQKLAVGTASRQIMQPFQERRVTLTVDPLWLTWYNLVPQYVPLPVLAKLAASETIPDAHGQYATRFYIVLADAVLPAAMALFAASLALMLLPYATPATSLIVIAFSGYTAHFLIKAGLIMGQNGFIPPLLAGFTVPVLLLLATAITLSRCGRQRRRLNGE